MSSLITINFTRNDRWKIVLHKWLKIYIIINFREVLSHNDVVFNNNGTVSSMPKHPLVWDEERSMGNSEDDMFVLPNIALLVSVYFCDGDQCMNEWVIFRISPFFRIQFFQFTITNLITTFTVNKFYSQIASNGDFRSEIEITSKHAL